MDDKHTLKMSKGKDEDEDAKKHDPDATLGTLENPTFPPPFVKSKAFKPVEPIVADPKPAPKAPNVKKSEGVTFIGQYKKYLAEFDASGQTYNCGMWDTEAQAVEAISKAKARLYA